MRLQPRTGAAQPSPMLTSICLLAVLVATLTLSWRALTGPFLFDDFPNLQHLAMLGGSLDWETLANYMAQYGNEPGRPLSMLSFVINDFAWPSEPWSFKYTNLQLHLLIGVLVFGCARSLARQHLEDTRANIAALLTMAAWLLHPMQLSTSMLVVQRMTQLSALLVLSGLWGYIVLATRATTFFRAVAAIAVLGTATVLAVLCKETGALAPLLAVVTNTTLLRARLESLPANNRRLLRWGCLLPIALLFTAIAWRWDSLTGYGNRDFSLTERLLTQCRVLCSYLYQILLPNLRGGGIYHDDLVVSRSLLQPWTTLPSLLLVCGAVLSAVVLRSKRPIFSFAVLWFLGGHLLESSVFPLELYFEHRNYLPMFGPLFAMALLVSSSESRRRYVALVLALIWILFASWLTWVQASIWGDARKLTTVWLIEHPMSARAVQQRAEYLSRHGSVALAAETMMDAFERGVRGSDFPLQVLNLACATRDRNLAKRVRPLVDVSLDSGSYDQALLGTVGKLRRHVQNGACPQILTQEQWLAITDRLLINREYVRPAARRYLHVERAYLFQHRRDLSGTMRELEAAWGASPSPDLAQLIAVTLASAGLYDDAIVWADRALDRSVRGVRGWFSQDDVRSRQLRDALEDARKR